MTLVETLIAAACVGLVLVVIALFVSSTRGELKRRQTTELLVTLDRALQAYHATTGQWPGDGSADRLIGTLYALPESRQVLDEIPHTLQVEIKETESRGGGLTFHDSWGRPLECITADSPSEKDRQAVAANGGRPILISAGPDGHIGQKDPAAAADNIRLMPMPQAEP